MSVLMMQRNSASVCVVLCSGEARREDGDRYPASTIRCLLSAINRILRANNAPFSMLDKQDIRFKPLLLTIDSVCCELYKDGIGVVRNSAMAISVEHKDAFCEQGLLGDSSSRVLCLTVFFYVGMQFCLRGVQEHHDLVPVQFVRYPSDVSHYNEEVYYVYHEFIP